MTDSQPAVFKRILVSLDTSDRGRAALEAAVRLALSTNAELQGLFVEDEDLVRLASLPFSREIELASASPRELQSINMERLLRVAAERAQQVFTSALQQVNIQWTFRIVRGTVTQASLAAAGDVDLLVIGQQGRCPRILDDSYLPKPKAIDKRVVSVFDGSKSACRALELAHRLAEPSPIVVLVLARNGDEVARQCMKWLNSRSVRAEVDQPVNPTEDAVLDFVKKWPPRVLVVNRDSPFISDEQISRLVNEQECPLILC